MKRNIPFLRFRFIAYIVSLAMFIIFLSVTIPRGGLNWGIDFVGGIKLRAQFAEGVTAGDIRSKLQDNGINASVQAIGVEEKNAYVISTKLLTEDLDADKSFDQLWTVVSTSFPGVNQLGLDSVGPTIGEYLKKSAIRLSVIAVVLMMVYLAFRFELMYSLGAMAALFHDLLLALLFCGLMQVEINTSVIAALLTIFGYSVNDTIVIFDRIRENVENETSPIFSDVINIGISQSISRTLLTSLTTLFAVLALYLLGGDTINDFALVLLFGVLVGTYSSIYVASPVVLFFNKVFHKQ